MVQEIRTITTGRIGGTQTSRPSIGHTRASHTQVTSIEVPPTRATQRIGIVDAGHPKVLDSVAGSAIHGCVEVGAGRAIGIMSNISASDCVGTGGVAGRAPAAGVEVVAERAGQSGGRRGTCQPIGVDGRAECAGGSVEVVIVSAGQVDGRRGAGQNVGVGRGAKKTVAGRKIVAAGGVAGKSY